VLVGADYSQIELRVLAHISKDPTLMSFFGEGVDVLKMVASHWMGMHFIRLITLLFQSIINFIK
jgi:DNA polymerase I